MSIVFGPIYNSQHGKIREWKIVINLFDNTNTQISIDSDNNTNIHDNYHCEYFTISGYTGMKMTQSAPTVINIGKNIGKKNETNVLTQSIKECKSKYASKLKAGYTENIKNDTTIIKNTMPFPMAVKSWKDHGNKLHYPLYIQPKLDGIRLLARFENNEVKLYTRRLHDIVGFAKLKSHLLEMFKLSNLKSFIVDGELYSHGMNLQVISGIVRNEAAEESIKEQLKYHVFDFFNVDKPMMSFPDRHDLLQKFAKSYKSDMIILNPTSIADNDVAADDLYNDYIRNGYEGVIYKSSDKPYEFDYNKEKRSSWYLKRKKQDDAEFEIIGYTHGNGKDKECIVFKLQGPNNKTFNCVPNGTYEYRKQLYTQAKDAFEINFKNKLAKVLYDDLSKDGVPLRGRIIQIGRDLSFD